MDTHRALLAAELWARPWAILPGAMAALMERVQQWAAGTTPQAARPAAAAVQSTIAIIPVQGSIFPRGGGLWAELFGGVSAEKLAATVAQYAQDASVSALVLDVDSPGGDVAGVLEAAAAVRAAAGQKPVIAIANHLAASAAYWLASQASEIMVTPSGEVGSIGVFAVHEDWSKALEQAGVTATLIRAGKYKAETNPYEPLTDEARAAVQAQVDEYYNLFVRDVAKGRGVSVADVRGGFGEGRTVLAAEAKRLGMVDRVGTLAEAVAVAGQLVRARRAPAAELEYRQRRARAARHE